MSAIEFHHRAIGIEEELAVVDGTAIPLIDADGDSHASFPCRLANCPDTAGHDSIACANGPIVRRRGPLFPILEIGKIEAHEAILLVWSAIRATQLDAPGHRKNEVSHLLVAEEGMGRRFASAGFGRAIQPSDQAMIVEIEQQFQGVAKTCRRQRDPHGPSRLPLSNPWVDFLALHAIGQEGKRKHETIPQ